MRACVYTCLFGDYEDLSAQPVAAASELPFICFTDNPDLSSETWQIRVIEPLLPADPRRSSRYPKLCPHRFLPDFEASFYIDNSVSLQVAPEVVVASLLVRQEHNMACLHHSFRATVADEFLAVRHFSYEHDAVLLGQLRTYAASGLDFSQKPIWGGLLLRFHQRPDVIECMENWLAEILTFSRRDQLSFHQAARISNFRFTAHPIDNHESVFHRWPVHTSRKPNQLDRKRNGPTDATFEEFQRQMREIIGPSCDPESVGRLP